MPGLQTLGGAVSEFFAPGNPAGIGMMANGAGQLASGGMGNPVGGAQGSVATPPQAMNPAAMGSGNGAPSLANSGMAMPATPPPSATPSAPPSTPPTMGQPAPSIGAPQGQSPFQQSMAALGPVGQSYMNYVQKMNEIKQEQKTAYAPPHSSASGQTSPLTLNPQVPIQVPPQY